MNILKGKYLAFIFFVYLAIFSVILWFPESAGLPMLLLGLFLLGVGSFIFFIRGKHAIPRKRAAALFAVFLIAVCAALGQGHYFLHHTLNPIDALLNGETYHVTGYVDEVFYEKPYRASYLVALETVNGEDQKGKITLETPFSAGLTANDKILFDGVFAELDKEYASYNRSRGVYAMAEAENIEKTGVYERPFYAFWEKVRSYLSEGFATYIGGEEAGFATALLMGERENLSGHTKLAFQRLGISHLLAVSGLHLSVIVGGFDFLLRFLTVPKRKKNILLMGFTLLFAAICGFSASVMRAAIMLCLLYFGELIGEKSDSLTSLFSAVVLIVIFRPSAVYDAGLWLSFASTFGILCVMPFCQGMFASKAEDTPFRILAKRFFRAVLSLPVMNFTALCFTMPITYLLYGGISLISPPANLIFVPTVQLLLYLIVFLAIVLPIPFAAAWIGTVCSSFIKLLTVLSHTLSNIKGIYISIQYPFAGYILLVLVVGVTVMLLWKKYKPIYTLAVFFSCVIMFGCCYGIFENIHADRTEVFLETDGNSDIVGIVCDGEAVVLDMTTGGYAVQERAVSAFADSYVCEIDALILTHLHSYHAGTLSRLTEKIKVHHLWIPSASSEKEDAMIDMIYEAVGDCCDITVYASGTDTAVFPFSGMTLRIPSREFLARSTHPVLSFSADIHAFPWENELCYIGAGGFETARDFGDTPLILCGAHGPITKHIFDADVFSSAHTVVFADRDTVAFTQIEGLSCDIVFAQELFGRCRIVFE